MESWRHIPSVFEPVAFVVAGFPVRWYAVFFLLGFFTVLATLLRRTRGPESPCDRECLLDLAAPVFAGILIGGRVGFALLYAPELLSHPVSLFLPVEPGTGRLAGIRGMSFFGGLVGGALALRWFVRARGIRFLKVADFLSPAIPIAIFFGRIGNFVNGELYGRVTDLAVGMYFPYAPDGGTAARHPSQLYEAVLEGIVPFLILSFIAGRRPREGALTLALLFSYALTRFSAECFREPDAGSPILFGWMTEGQVLAVLTAVIAAVFLVIRRSARTET